MGVIRARDTIKFIFAKSSVLIMVECLIKVPRTGFEPVTHSLEGCCMDSLELRNNSRIIRPIANNKTHTMVF